MTDTQRRADLTSAVQAMLGHSDSTAIAVLTAVLKQRVGNKDLGEVLDAVAKIYHAPEATVHWEAARRLAQAAEDIVIEEFNE